MKAGSYPLLLSSLGWKNAVVNSKALLELSPISNLHLLALRSKGCLRVGPVHRFHQRGTEHCPPPLMLSSVCSHHYYCSIVIHGITAMGNTTITCVRAWMLVLMSPLATWEIIKLIVDAVLLCISSKCGETARILESGAKENIQLLQGIPMSWNYAIPH